MHRAHTDFEYADLSCFSDDSNVSEFSFETSLQEQLDCNSQNLQSCRNPQIEGKNPLQGCSLKRAPMSTFTLPGPQFAEVVASNISGGNSTLQLPGVLPASRLERLPVPTAPFGVPEVDKLTGGLPRGALTEIYGTVSSGRTTLILSALAAATLRGELCAWVDAADSFHPHSAVAAGVDLESLLWVRCSDIRSKAESAPHTYCKPGVDDLTEVLRAKQQLGSVMPAAKVWYGRPPARSERIHTHGVKHTDRVPKRPAETPHDKISLPRSNKRFWAARLDQALRATDLLLQAGGFGMVVLDLGDVPATMTHRIPLTSWFRFRRVVENTNCALIAIEQAACAKTCASLVLRAAAHLRAGTASDSTPAHAHLLAGMDITVDLVQERIGGHVKKKSPQSARVALQSKAEWAG